MPIKLKQLLENPFLGDEREITPFSSIIWKTELALQNHVQLIFHNPPSIDLRA